jgi:hypothetical protein
MDNEHGPADLNAFLKASNKVDFADQIDFRIAIEGEKSEDDVELRPPRSFVIGTLAFMEDVVLTWMLGAALAEAADPLDIE